MSVMSLQSTYTKNPSQSLIGQLAVGPATHATMKNANASASMPMGTPVVYKPSAATSDLDAATVANSSDLVAGIIMHSDDYQRAWTDDSGTHGELDSTGIIVGALLSVVRDGTIWVICSTGCVPGDRLFVAYASGAQYASIGLMGNITGSAQTIDCTAKGEWRSTATAGAGAWLKVNFSNK